MGADDRSRSPVNARLGAGGQPSKKAVMSAEFVAAEMPAAQSETDHVASCSSSRDSHGEFDFDGFGGGSTDRQMVFIELCAGSAVLSATAQRHGYRVLPVDCKRNRHKPRCRIVSLDLSEAHAWEVLEYIWRHLVERAAKQGVYPCPMGRPGLSLFVRLNIYLECQT